MAESHLASVFNRDGFNVIDHFTYVLGGDGCMMEGISSEAFSLAGHLGLSKLIVLYDSNSISIEGSTDLAFSEDVSKRMEAFGFQVIEVDDGHDLVKVSKAIEEAKNNKEKPSFINLKTRIGFGCPAKEGKASAHGEPLGADNIKSLRENLGWEYEEPFFVPEEVYEHYKSKASELKKVEQAWDELLKKYFAAFPEKKTLWDRYFVEEDLSFLDKDEYWAWDEKADATRNISGKILNRVKLEIPNLIGGSADLAPSNKTYLSDMGDFAKNSYAGRNLHFGVRELAMTAITNGIILHGGLKAYCATFFVFSDYTKPMARLSSLMGIPASFVFTHDSIGVGEDGPTHEPIEQLAMLRAMPNFHSFRPADATETLAAWYSALKSEKTPTAIILTRQNLPQLAGSSKEALKGGYVIKEASRANIDLILIASGSEVALALEAAKELEEMCISVRVVSMPCMDIFEEQSREYKEAVLPKAVSKRIFIEALSGFGLDKYVGFEGEVLSMKDFGASAPQAELFKKFGFTVERIVDLAKNML
jgi:transketolase